MYISVNDRPVDKSEPTEGQRGKVAPIVISLGFVSLLTDISSESVAAILPLYLTSVVGLSTVAYGFVDGLYQGISALVRIAAGWASDRGDHPKWVALFGYGLSAIARFGLLFAGGFAAIAAVISADRIGKGIRTAPRDALIAASTPSAHLGRAFGVHRTLDTIGAAVGPLLAFGVLWAIPEGYTTVMVISLAFALLGVALLGLLVPDHRPRAARAELGEVRRPFRWREVADPRLTKLLIVAGGLGLLTIGDGFIYLALLDRGGFAAKWFPMMYVGTNIAYLILAIPIGRIADRVGRARVLVMGHVALLLTYASAALPSTATMAAVVPLVLLGTFYASTDGVIAAVAGRLVRPEVRASGIASAQTVVALARLVASTGFGLLWYAMGPRAALVTVAGALLVAIPMAILFVRNLDGESDAE